MGLLQGGGGPLQWRRAGVLLLLWRVEVGHSPWTEGRGRRVMVLRAGRQRLVGTLSHHVCDALAVVAFLWLGGQPALLGMVIQTSTVITTADVGGEGNNRRLCVKLTTRWQHDTGNEAEGHEKKKKMRPRLVCIKHLSPLIKPLHTLLFRL